MDATYHEKQEAKRSAALLKYMPPGGTLLDGGANVGEFARLALERFDKVICVEANPNTFTRLRENTKDTNILVPYNKAISARCHETVQISNPNHSTSATCTRQPRKGKPEEYYSSVTTMSLDRICELFVPSAIKLDIEGFEYEALDAWTKTEGVNGLIVEFHKLTSPTWYARMYDCVQRLKLRGLYPVSGYKESEDKQLKWGFQLVAFRRA